MTLSVVRWGQHPLSFQLASPDSGVVARASLVFRPWRLASSAETSYAWRVNPVAAGANRAWRISDESGAAPLTRESIPAAVRCVEFLAVQKLVDSPAACTMHGALVARNGCGIALVGRAESGKSTLACALWQRGFALLGDDIALVDVGRRVAWPAPRRVGLRESSRALLSCTLWRRVVATPTTDGTDEGCLFHPDDVDGRTRPPSVPLKALVFLDRPGRRAGRDIARLDPAHGLVALLPHTNLALRTNTGEAIHRLRPLLESVAAWDLARTGLDGMIHAVEHVLEASD